MWRRAAWAGEAWAAELASRWRRWTVLPGDTVVHGLRDVRGTVVHVDAREVRIELAPGWVEGWPRGLEGWDRAPRATSTTVEVGQVAHRGEARER